MTKAFTLTERVPRRLSEMNWMQVGDYLKQDHRLILPLGSLESHGYLSLATDRIIPSQLADRLSAATGVLVAPPLPYGFALSLTAYPGTISFSASTYLGAVSDLVCSAVRGGFRSILILNGHGGNSFVRAGLQEVAATHPEARLEMVEWWRLPVVEGFWTERGMKQSHANFSENFPFTRVAPTPESEKPYVDFPSIASPSEVRKALGDGTGGGPYEVDDRDMERLLEMIVNDLVPLLDKL